MPDTLENKRIAYRKALIRQRAYRKRRTERMALMTAALREIAALTSGATKEVGLKVHTLATSALNEKVKP